MSDGIEKLLEDNKQGLFRFLNKVLYNSNNLYVKGNLLEILEEYKVNVENEEGDNHDAIEEILQKTNEAVCKGNLTYFEIRDQIGKAQHYLFGLEDYYYEKISRIDYLKIKEEFVNPGGGNDILNLNFETFYDKFPSVREPKNIGKGVEFLNRYLSSKMFTEPDKLSKALFDFLFVHKYKNQQLILNDRVKNSGDLSSKIDKALNFLRKEDEDSPYSNFKHKLQELGFEPGLGNNAGAIIESLEQLDRLLHSPDHQALTDFLSKIPMIFNIAIISPHGYFGQEGVLGMPDTGGQVVYILDQVKALEKEMTKSLRDSGLEAKPKIIILTRLIPNAGDTKCNQRLKKCTRLRTPGYSAFRLEISIRMLRIIGFQDLKSGHI